MGDIWRRRLCGVARLGRSGAAFGVEELKQINSNTTKRCTRPPAVSAFSGSPARLKVGRDWRAAGELGRCVAAAAWMREAGSTLAAGSWLLWARLRGVGCVGGRGLVALARRLGFGGATDSTAAQQGAAPDRLQLRSSFLLTSLPAAGELGRCVAASALSRVMAVLWPLICRVVSRYLAASAPRWARLARSGAAFGFRVAKRNQQPHNKALHPTARSVVVFLAFRLGW